jgi:hypothetical protein
MQPPAAGDWIHFGGTQIQESPRRRLTEQPVKLTILVVIGLGILICAPGWTLPYLVDPGSFVSLECTSNGRHSWSLVVDRDGNAGVTKTGWEGTQFRRLKLKQRLPGLEAAIRKDRFFQLPGTLGQDVVDGSEERIHIRTFNFDHTVTIRFIDFSRRNANEACAERLSSFIHALADEAN